MSISYKSIVGHTAKMTLPSVDTWGTNMNILRDPNRGIFTQRLDKVGQTSEITQMIQDSADRSNEAILVYARGVNPMVSVSYDNYGNNGGQRIGGTRSAGMVDGQTNSGKQSYLPYRIMNGGAFRPPTRDLRELLPLSRLPRVWTSSFTNPGFVDFSKKIMCPNEDTKLKGIQQEPIRACSRPTVTYKIQTPIIETYEVKNVIKNPIKIEGKSGVSSNAKFNGEYGDNPLGRVVENPLRQDINVNLVGPTKNESLEIDTIRYIQDGIQAEAQTNKSRNIRTTSIDELMNVDTSGNIKENMNLSYEGQIQPTFKNYDYMYDNDISLESKLTAHDVVANTTRNIHKPTEHSLEKVYVMNRPVVQVSANTTGKQVFNEVGTRNYNLRPTINAGSYNPNVGVSPVYHHDNLSYNMDTQKVDFRKRVYDLQTERYSALNEPVNF